MFMLPIDAGFKFSDIINDQNHDSNIFETMLGEMCKYSCVPQYTQHQPINMLDIVAEQAFKIFS